MCVCKKRNEDSQRKGKLDDEMIKMTFTSKSRRRSHLEILDIHQLRCRCNLESNENVSVPMYIVFLS